MNKFYTGIGSRTITPEIKNDMMTLAGELEKMDYTLRSGNATGSDQAFASGTNKAQIWLPWTNFEKEFQREHPEHVYKTPNKHIFDEEADESVNKFHPIGSALVGTSRLLMARNYRQVRGWGEPDSSFIICWTHDGTDVGGTGQAIRVAKHYKIPVFNLFDMTKDEVFE